MFIFSPHSAKRKTLWVTIFGAALLAIPGSTRAEPAKPTAPRPVKIVLMGDSTVMSHDASRKADGDAYGWGHALQDEMGPGFEVVNFAAPGRSSKSFWEEKRAEHALQLKPDWVVVQFGHNDEPQKGPKRATEANGSYKDYLRMYLKAIREAGARPILVTSVARRTFLPDGHLDNSPLRPYAEAMIAVAKEEDVPCFDLNAESLRYFEKLGSEKATTMGPASKPSDMTHFNQEGARQITALVAGYLRQVIPKP